MKCRFEDFPLDPRLIRSLRVTVFMLDLKSLRNFTGDDLKNNLDKIVFVGFADTEND